MSEPIEPGVTTPVGFSAWGVHCGIKSAPEKLDLTLIAAAKPAAAAATFTQNRMCAAPVTVSRRHVASGRIRAIIANSGNANAATGKRGEKDALTTCNLTAAKVGCKPKEVFVLSTGMIGNYLPMEKIRDGITIAHAALARGAEADDRAARGIMTTDAAPKRAAARGKVGGRPVTVAGVCKGAGMIAPNMATMLCLITTDAAIAPKMLRAALEQSVAGSFNTIRVDGHTSTNDTVVVLASGAAGNREIKRADKDFAAFVKLLDAVTLDLALKIVRDGEGADKLCEIAVEGAVNDAEARAIAVALADSPLWKCAMTCGDPNWGRIVCAVGNTVSRGGPKDLVVHLGDHKVYSRGEAGGIDRGLLKPAMFEDPIRVRIKLRHGRGKALIRTADINHKYIAENTEKST
jgi:glutamate N-acetyltransferase/amino-acid N-acetyltransferase